ncbi:prepilin peptidase [Haliovirga abyssi]|uniref:Prepilin leader peptidase/N-methyltransferase n=1 Tax=Haliovirga abyssi TaxID=2996794 RepID=A0AAU9DZX7_9FUSO|nr:A24 family peptidase [Haliovirga abyssi]BDU49575.1 type 4 prepilin-like proteins leader peptide-processing enzyme [Haliovirga abyssi]
MVIMYIYIFIIGAVIGSFLNVCIYRIPRGESIAYPPSHCPNCGYKIKWYDNIPIISYFILLRGKCRQCKTKISLQYPLIELLTGILFLGLFLKYEFSILTIKYMIFTALLIVLSGIDIEEHILPDKITFFMIVIGFIFSFFSETNILYSFIGAATYSFPFMLLYGFGEDLLKKDIMGFGDVKLTAAIGAFFGYRGFYNLYMFFMLAFTIGAVISLILIILKIKTRKDIIAFGPFIAVAGYIMIMIM